MAKNHTFHSLYLLIILALLALIFWPSNLVEPDPAPDGEVEPERSIAGQISLDPNRAKPVSQDTHQVRELLQTIAQRDATIADLEARIASLEASSGPAPALAEDSPPQQLTELSDDEYFQLANAHREQQEQQRDQAFANARPTSYSEQAQHKLETSFYSVDNMPRFEDLSIECREIYCDIEVTFADSEVAREFLTYYSRRVFDHAELPTTMTRSESQSNLVLIKADLAPPLEE